MTSFELLQRALPEGQRGSVLWSFLNGAAAGLFAQTFTYPGDTIRRRMQNNGAGGAARTYDNSWHCARVIWRTEGVRGLFKGAYVNTLRVLPAAGTQFVGYEWLCTVLNARG